MTPSKKSTASIESKLNDLEKILKELESGNLELDESLKKFEKGVKLSRECQKTLEEAELKIKVLMGNELEDSDSTLSQ
ncbi:MAG: exodeoxyribonuclease VII small subunit [Gammaproteobacteria bacterium]|nr:exodeoxyribonuclease VII small subunit [Gammaproteobacteria bacterium]OUT95330.1 MAG: exodeoxyribonuclease VII small subunit [Gammaproteobacteria bacterium TMED36]|tara:strand:+ start:18960 stop:19193 length:234 start_codon:yes stop_codon:yes gene_type:complete